MRGFPPVLLRFAVAVVAFVDVIPGLPACSGAIEGSWMMLLLLPNAGLPTCSGEIRTHFLFSCCHFWRAFRLLWWTLLLPLLFLLLACLGNASRSGVIVVLGDLIFANVSRLGVVIAQGDGLGAHDVSTKSIDCHSVVCSP